MMSNVSFCTHEAISLTVKLMRLQPSHLLLMARLKRARSGVFCPRGSTTLLFCYQFQSLHATASWACRLSACTTFNRNPLTSLAWRNALSSRLAASSQNIRFCPLARAKACSSISLTAVCNAVPSVFLKRH